jgi:glycosyltransferase involved in cell wall biosynthesis
MSSKLDSIIHITPSIGQRSFGLGPAVLNLTNMQNHYGLDAKIWCLDDDVDRQWASVTFGIEVEKIQSFPRLGFNALGLSRKMERAAASSEYKNISIVHQHAIWTGVSRVTCIMRKVHKVPTVITPHGSLQKWALNKSMWKKKIVLCLYERKNLHGLLNPIAVIPNGISNNWLDSRGDGEVFRRQFDISIDKRILLFLSRITPKKGILMLLEALHEVRKNFADWQFVIAGADEFGHQAEVENYIIEKGLMKFVKIVGPLFGQIKRDAFAATDLLVLPSFSEGAPIVILEALGAEVPVLATKASPWKDLETFSCGWWPNISTVAIIEALRDAIKCSPEQLKLMGQRGKKLVADKYTWDRSAQMTIELYQWLLRYRDQPRFVVTN